MGVGALGGHRDNDPAPPELLEGWSLEPDGDIAKQLAAEIASRLRRAEAGMRELLVDMRSRWPRDVTAERLLARDLHEIARQARWFGEQAASRFATQLSTPAVGPVDYTPEK